MKSFQVEALKCGGGVNRLWAPCLLCTGTLCTCGGGVNRLWAQCLLCTGTLCKCGGGVNGLRMGPGTRCSTCSSKGPPPPSSPTRRRRRRRPPPAAGSSTRSFVRSFVTVWSYSTRYTIEVGRSFSRSFNQSSFYSHACRIRSTGGLINRSHSHTLSRGLVQIYGSQTLVW